MKMKNDYPRGWYTYIYPEGEVIIPLDNEEDCVSEEESHVLH